MFDNLGENWYIWLIVIVILTGLMIFMNIRGRKKQAAQAEETKQKLVVGAKILTISGVTGTICSVDDNAGTMVVEVLPDNVKLTFVKEALHSIYKENADELEAVINYDDDSIIKSDKKDAAPVINYDDEK